MGKFPGIKWRVEHYVEYWAVTSRADERGGKGILPWAPERSIYSNRTVKYSIKAVTTYILPWAPQALSAALVMRIESRMIFLTAIASISVMNLLRETKI